MARACGALQAHVSVSPFSELDDTAVAGGCGSVRLRRKLPLASPLPVDLLLREKMRLRKLILCGHGIEAAVTGE